LIADELKERRQRLGLTPQDLAHLLGVADDTIDGWESGRVRIPRSVRLRALLGNLQQKHREILRTGDGFREWEKWLINAWRWDQAATKVRRREALRCAVT
jgi:transcriptional regulator with XRE-family HTH domain